VHTFQTIYLQPTCALFVDAGLKKKKTNNHCFFFFEGLLSRLPLLVQCLCILQHTLLLQSLNVLSKGSNAFCYNINTTFNNGSLGSRIDEERSEMR
jgi:hypothetical protein